MRVLHVIPSLERSAGGPPAALLGLALAQAKCGLAVSVLSAFPSAAETEVSGRLERQGVGVVQVGPTKGKLGRHADLAGAAERCVAAADVVHIHALWEEIQHQAARAARRRSVPYLVRPCGMLDPWSLRQSRWVKKILLAWRVRGNLDRAAALHFTTSTERDLVGALKLKAPAIVEPNGVDLQEFDRLPAPGTFRAQHPALGDRPMIVFLSRLHPKKGLDLLVPAFAGIAADPKLDGAALVIAGPDADGYRAQVEAMAARHGVADRVLFTGMVGGEQRVALLAEAALFVLPSYQENFGNVVIESLAAGTPVIVSDQVNLQSEVLAAGVGGVVPTQAGPLAAEMLRWMGDGALRRLARDKARPFVREHYDWMRIAARWQGRYAELAAR
jgi:glycosyltransferase involved in cell wall biosynthesis